MATMASSSPSLSSSLATNCSISTINDLAAELITTCSHQSVGSGISNGINSGSHSLNGSNNNSHSLNGLIGGMGVSSQSSSSSSTSSSHASLASLVLDASQSSGGSGSSSNNGNSVSCQGCKSRELAAVARCYDCANFLCPNCVMAHEFMHCFEGHRVATLNQSAINGGQQSVNLGQQDTIMNNKDSLMSALSETSRSDLDGHEHDFLSDVSSDYAGLRNNFGYIRSSSSGDSKQPPISRPNGLTSSLLHAHTNGHSFNTSLSNDRNSGSIGMNHHGGHQNNDRESHSLLSKRFNLSQNSNPSQLTSNGVSNSSCVCSGRSLSLSSASLSEQLSLLYDKWSIGSNSTTTAGSASPDNVGSSIFNKGSLGSSLTSSLAEQFNSLSDPVIDQLSNKLLSSANILPIKSQIKRQKMIYHCKFGEFGVMEGQFTEPSGVAVNAQNDIIVADTNNHRIQIFDKEGRFKFQFGECGKRDGQLLYPNRVAVVKQSGDIIVTERSPTHQIQIYNQYGQFVRKFGANILQHPRGVTVDNKGRIIVVECKVMRVIIFDQVGNVLQKFGCSKHLEFPNGVVVNDKQEIFISDNRAHCVKVFSYDGTFLRQIGGEGLTNYPIGVCINEAGEILVADNHNNFNITIFTQDGCLVNALESKVKHAQCFDVALMDDNSVVLASKDYRIYIYRYLQLQSLAAQVASSTLC